ncbi:MAG: hypothetical protein ACTHL1_11425, partial [Burkholderiaceae bacterium]
SRVAEGVVLTTTGASVRGAGSVVCAIAHVTGPAAASAAGMTIQILFMMTLESRDRATSH